MACNGIFPYSKALFRRSTDEKWNYMRFWHRDYSFGWYPPHQLISKLFLNCHDGVRSFSSLIRQKTSFLGTKFLSSPSPCPQNPPAPPGCQPAGQKVTVAFLEQAGPVANWRHAFGATSPRLSIAPQLQKLRFPSKNMRPNLCWNEIALFVPNHSSSRPPLQSKSWKTDAQSGHPQALRPVAWQGN